MSDSAKSGSVLLRGGRVIDPGSGLDATRDVVIEGGVVRAIEDRVDVSGVDRVVACDGLIVAPGLVDPHVHLRDPGQTHKEDIGSGTRAAVMGGFTTVCCMPNTAPALDSPEMVEYVKAKSAREGKCRVFSVACATAGRKGERLAEIGLCDRAGAVGFSDDGDVIEDASVMRAVLATVAGTGKAFMQHCQETTLTRGAVMHAGEVAQRLGLKGWAREAEELIIERDVRLNKSIGCAYHVQHMSSGGSVEIVARARRDGQPVTAEASPHHLLLTDEAVETQGSMAKMNPPLRERSDIEALKEGIREGVITVLATDHAPHHVDEKRNPVAAAPFGIIGLESALGLYHKALIETGVIDWARMLGMMTIEPAKLCRLDGCGIGSLKVGGVADVTVIDPDHSWTLREGDLGGKSVNTPFLGWGMGVRAVMTIVGGEVRYAMEGALAR
jgi:dihydroorotase